MKRLLALLIVCVLLAGCESRPGEGTAQEAVTEAKAPSAVAEAVAPSDQGTGDETNGSDVPADGVYVAEFITDSGMFHVNEANDGKGQLTVKDGAMTIHVSLASKNIVNLFPGKAEDAQKEGAQLLQPTTDSVTYSDGTTEEVNGFDIPVPVLDEEFDLALIGKKGKWYDHRVKVTCVD